MFQNPLIRFIANINIDSNVCIERRQINENVENILHSQFAINDYQFSTRMRNEKRNWNEDNTQYHNTKIHITFCIEFSENKKLDRQSSH